MMPTRNPYISEDEDDDDIEIVGHQTLQKKMLTSDVNMSKEDEKILDSPLMTSDEDIKVLDNSLMTSDEDESYNTRLKRRRVTSVFNKLNVLSSTMLHPGTGVTDRKAQVGSAIGQIQRSIIQKLNNPSSPIKHSEKNMTAAEETEPPVVQIQHTVEIEGIKLNMPVKPYPCQREVMGAIINGCKNMKNSLIESPTGSGKTLALLCGALGWVTDYKKNMRIELEKRDAEMQKRELDLLRNEFEPELVKKEAVCNSSTEPCEQNKGKLDDDDLMDDWGEGDWAEDAVFEKPIEIRAVPKVFYCSRTHKQLEQVVGELRRTSYAQTMKMTLLSSREYTCVQEGNMNKNKLCAELLDPTKKRGCCYYTEANKNAISTFQSLERIGVQIPWDIEELKRAGKSVGICPYFAARNLMTEADLILCPYNYIVDEGIRKSMQINVAGSVIIIDEAHNIEDFCREAGSKSITVKDLETIISNCNGVSKDSKFGKVYYAEIIHKYCASLSKFILDARLRVESCGLFSIERWTGSEFVAALQKAVSITPESTRSFFSAVRDATTAKNTERDALRMNFHPPPALDTDNIKLLEDLVWGLEMITSVKYSNDYRMYIKQFSKNQCTEISLVFSCMIPSVVFASLCAETRSIILASGTLSPMRTFESELGVKFPYVVQADHVTPKEQVCIKCIDRSSDGFELRATFQNINTPKFQDDIGNVVFTACSSMPHGILVFFSAYSVMEKLCKRWQSTGLWGKLCDIKHVFQEPRDNAGMQEIMAEYREIIRNTAKPVGTITGALLFAVYRGKVAEGIDFSDNEARCVITLGIPYAVRQDPSVDLKYKYNDQNRPTKGLLSGNDWYTTNAFRGLNQALGRAIRHQNDWAAIIMIDSRFTDKRQVALLPEWIRSMGFQEERNLRSLLNRFRAIQTRRETMKARQNGFPSSTTSLQ